VHIADLRGIEAGGHAADLAGEAGLAGEGFARAPRLHGGRKGGDDDDQHEADESSEDEEDDFQAFHGRDGGT